MALIAAISYDGANTLTADVSGCVPGDTYTMQAYGTNDQQVAVGTTVSLSCSAGVGSLPAGFPFDVEVHQYDGANILARAYGTTTFLKGAPAAAQLPGEWLYDGDRTVTFTAVLENGVGYGTVVNDVINGGVASSVVVGAGVEATITIVLPSAPTDGVDFYPFWAYCYTDNFDGDSLGSKIFFPADTGAATRANRGWSGSLTPDGTNATFSYGGGSSASVTFQTQDGVEYSFLSQDPNFPSVQFVGDGTRMTQTVTGIGGTAGQVFSLILQESASSGSPGTGNYLATKLFTVGSSGVHDDAATFLYDGANSVDVTFATTPGQRYVVEGYSIPDGQFYSSGPLLAAGATITHTASSPDAAIIGDGFWVQVYQWKNWPSADDVYPAVASHLFQTGIPGSGVVDLTYGSSTPEASVTTVSADDITRVAGELRSVVNPGGVSSIAYFQYGLTEALGSETPHVSVGSGSAPVDFAQTIEDLMPNHRYYYRAVLEQA